MELEDRPPRGGPPAGLRVVGGVLQAAPARRFSRTPAEPPMPYAAEVIGRGQGL